MKIERVLTYSLIATLIVTVVSFGNPTSYYGFIGGFPLRYATPIGNPAPSGESAQIVGFTFVLISLLVDLIVWFVISFGILFFALKKK